MGAAFRPVWGGLGLAVLLLAALNVAFRIGHETVQLWDEALYAMSALDVLSSGNWVHTTIFGVTDYYNAKPPLNIWLIALSFKAFGVSVTTLRLPSIIAAWSTIALLLWWLRRVVDAAAGTLAALVLTTCYGFLYVHSGREANTDAIFVFLFLVTAVTLWSAVEHPWRRVWLGPILAAVFLLRGMAVVMPLSLVAIAEVSTPRTQRARWIPLGAAAATFVALTVPWAIARWQVDRWTFFGQLFLQDFIARTTSPLDEHRGSVLFYLHQLQKNHYEWLVAAFVASLCLPWRSVRARGVPAGWRKPVVVLLVSWGLLALLVPTLTATKVAWYLNPFYPMFAAGVASVITTAWRLTHQSHPGRAAAIALVTALAVVVAESKLVWQSYVNRDFAGSKQGELLARADDINGHTVYAASWNLADVFVLSAVGGKPGIAKGIDEFFATSHDGDFWLGEAAHDSVNARGVPVSYLLIRRSTRETADSRPCVADEAAGHSC